MRKTLIQTIFGMKGSGKTNLSFSLMHKKGGRVVYFSPVEVLPIKHTEVWSYDEIPYLIQNQRPGEVLLIRLAEPEALDVVSCEMMQNYNDYRLFIDEVDQYAKSRELKTLIHYSRHFHIDIITNTRRYTDVPRLLTSQSDVLSIFQTREPRDIDYLKNFCGQDAIEKVENLKDFEYLHFEDKRNFSIKKARKLKK